MDVSDFNAISSHSAYPQTALNVLAGGRHSAYPDIAHLILLVFEAVLEVVCVSLPGYIVARMGMFDAEMQKFVANLNVTLFTPCLSMHSSEASCKGLGALTSPQYSQSSPRS